MSETTHTTRATDDLIEAREETMRRATEIAARLGVIAIVVAWCLQIIAPFVGIVIWGLIIAIALQSPYDAISRKIGWWFSPRRTIVSLRRPITNSSPLSTNPRSPVRSSPSCSAGPASPW